MLRRTVLLLLVVVPLAGCGQKMEEFTSTQYKFKAKFPGKPKEDSQSAAGLSVKMFTVESRDGAMTVGVIDLPIPAGESDAKIQDRLDGAQEGAIRNVSGTLKSSSKVTLSGKYPGREFSASITKPKTGQVRAKVFLVGTRLYQVMVMGTDSYATGSQANEFLNSFQLVE